MRQGRDVSSSRLPPQPWAQSCSGALGTSVDGEYASESSQLLGERAGVLIHQLSGRYWLEGSCGKLCLPLQPGAQAGSRGGEASGKEGCPCRWKLPGQSASGG